MTAIHMHQTQASARRDYCAPALMQFGSVSDLTAGGSKPGKENEGNLLGNDSNQP